MAVADTLATFLAAAPELVKMPSLTLSAAQGAANALTVAPNPQGHVQSTAQTLALALILHGFQKGSQNVVEAAYQPDEPDISL